jgi:uncharacterized protein (DUF305 family)
MSTPVETAGPSQGLRVARDRSQASRDRKWWIALGVALLFLFGAVGYFVGVRATQDESTLSDIDVGFLQDMLDHHDQAVQLALLQLANGEDPTARDFAQETILTQRREIGIMERMLEEQGIARPAVPREVMSWMNMGMPLSEMPGMASPDEFEALENARGPEADRLFLELMREHHLGGTHMADYAGGLGSNESVKALANRIAEYQRVEVNEYDLLMQRLGLAP